MSCLVLFLLCVRMAVEKREATGRRPWYLRGQIPSFDLSTKGKYINNAHHPDQACLIRMIKLRLAAFDNFVLLAVYYCSTPSAELHSCLGLVSYHRSRQPLWLSRCSVLRRPDDSNGITRHCHGSFFYISCLRPSERPMPSNPLDTYLMRT